MERLFAARTFGVERYYTDETFAEIETISDLHEVIPRLCYPRVQAHDFTLTPPFPIEDQGNLLLWSNGGHIQIIELLEDEDLILRPEEREKSKEFSLQQQADFIARSKQVVAESGDFYTVFRDLEYWNAITPFLTYYVPHLQQAVKRWVKLDPDHYHYESQLAQLQQTAKYQRTVGLNQFKITKNQKLDQQLVTTYIDTIEELSWYLAEMVIDSGKIPEFLESKDD